MAKELCNNQETIDAIIEDLNMLPKLLIENQFIAFAHRVAKMYQNLFSLKKSIEDEINRKNEYIEQIKNQLRDFENAHIEKDGAE